MSNEIQSGDEWARRKKFMMITPEVSKLLPEVWKAIEPALPEILDGFYAHAGSVPALAKMVGSQASRLELS